MRRRARIFLYSGLMLLGLAMALAISTVLVFRSAWFHNAVHDRIVAEIERSTGGRAEIGGFEFDWHTLTARVKGFVLHGKERAPEPALLQADSLQVGLKVISALRRDVDIASLIVERPSVNLIVYPDGSTNMPSPKLPSPNEDPIQRLLDIAVGRFEAHGGTFAFKDEKTPFDIRAENLRAVLDFDRSGPMYKGHVASKQVRLNSSAAGPLAMDLDADVRLLKDRIEIPDARLRTERSKVDASGALTNILQPRGEFNVRASVSLAELGKPLRLPIEHRGEASFDGKVRFAGAPKFDYAIQGRFDGRDLAVRNGGVQISGIRVRSAVEVTPAGLRATGLTGTAMGGTFSGSAELRNYRDLAIAAEAGGLSLSQIGSIAAPGRTLGFSGTVSGPVRVTGVVAGSGLRDAQVHMQAHIAPAPGGVPVEGLVDLNYSAQSRQTQLGQSWISTPHSRVDVSGTLGQTLTVSLRSSDLSDFQPALDLAGARADKIPIELKNGTLTSAVTVAGPLDNPRITGKASASNFDVEGQHVDSASADVDLTAAAVHANSIAVNLEGMHFTGSGQIGLANWRPVDSSPVSASVNVSGADLPRLAARAGQKDFPITGTGSASLTLSGQYGSPAATGHIHVDRPAGFGEQFDSADANVTLSGDNLVIRDGELKMAKSKLDFTGTYSHQRNEWETGGIAFQASTTGLPIATVEQIRRLHPDLNGDLTLQATATARVVKGVFNLKSLQSRAELRAVSVEGTRFGNVQLTGETRGETLELKLAGNVRESKIEGTGQWQLAGDYPGRGDVRFTSIRIATLKRLVSKATGAGSDLPFEGSVEGKIEVAGPLKKPNDLNLTLTLPRLEIVPQPEQRLRAGARAQDLSLRNVQPVVIRGTATRLDFASAQFAAKDTNLQVAGTVGLNEKALWNLDVRGGVNLAILQLFNPDLVAQGRAVVDATVKGPLRDPQLNGKLELRKASLYLGDLPIGVDNANGLVLFDRNRATIQKITAEVGGGQIALSGFVGFGAGPLVYRVQAAANQVRLRYPEGVSLTANAELSLSGTSASSLVAGTITVMRAAFMPRTDVGGMLSQFGGSQPDVTGTASDYLKNIQFDVRVESGPSLEVTTSLARNIESEAELRLRGTAARPVLLGNVSVTQGEIELFGNKYEINRGEIRFMNPTRIEPFFDVDLQTKARGIEVTISFNGTLNKLNLTYRSDPPLQSNEIIALLAMGRDPSTTSGLANAQVSSQSLLQTGGGAVEQAIAAPVSGRLQRFFGVSKLKIDPQLTGVNNLPEARLTVEQSISRDITLTYITNLARTNEQLVQIQWDINRKWSAIATREENGVFGIDFQYRKRFK
jgi:translocation and assembly module TamB